MGQAFDRDGNVLGEAFGDTKREVLEKLEKAHGADAHEIRIKSIQDKMAAVEGARDPMVPKLDRMLQFFKYEHLPSQLQEASKPFCDLAGRIVEKYPSNPERTVALRKLLEAKDAAVRTLLYEA